MADEAALEGACSCGRNHIIILAPPSFQEVFSINYDDRAEHGRDYARSLSLRVPLSHIRSTTYADYPGETHHSIRRVFTPRHAPHSKRHFCGFCGTHLTHWTEEEEGEADWIDVNLWTLHRESLERLANEGLLPGATDTGNRVAPREQSGEVSPPFEGRQIRGAPWFEEMIEGSQLGRIKRRKGGQTSADGRSKVEWEVIEFTNEPEDGGSSTGNSSGKRKHDQAGLGGDVEMGA